MQLDISDDVLRSYAFFSGILVVKMLLMSVLTVRQRFAKNVFANPDDAKTVKNAVCSYSDQDVERVRRAHLNDVENILPFFVIGFLYCLTRPDASTANMVFKIFTGARIAHTLIYIIFFIPQPARFVSCIVGHFANLYLAFKVILYFS